eukprot:TRINITY_DN553_c0_g1_i1.p1 TRINITY_DN553_c0_g1~~TRINITY_DN553_c0_g1_i1.p1  ORF type:complete len:407 (-),score=66.34 TRINITY_DN553_c0_g1_i1:52-1272(-)
MGEEATWQCLKLGTEVAERLSVFEEKYSSTHPEADLTELSNTVKMVRTLIVPYSTSAINDLAFDICIQGIKRNLTEICANLHNLSDLITSKDSHLWKNRKIELYKKDFRLKQKLDQFKTLFPPEGKGIGVDVIVDPQGKQFWITAFGPKELLVPWGTFFHALEASLGQKYTEEEDALREYLDFTEDNFVTPFEWDTFLHWFGPMKGCFKRMLRPLERGFLCGFCPAVEADRLLGKKPVGTYLIRFSKTRIGSYAVTFVNKQQVVKHVLLYSVPSEGVTLKNPPHVYSSLTRFAKEHSSKLQLPVGNDWSNSEEWRKQMEAKRQKIADGVTKISSGQKSDMILGVDSEDENEVAEESVCTVCMDAEIESVFLECAHSACCVPCANKLKLCPICRAPIARVIKIYRPT